MKKSWVTAVMWVALVGCGDKSPTDKCEDLVSSLCDRAVDCISGASGMRDACVDAFHQQLACSATKSVSASYDTCIDTIDRGSCQSLFSSDSQTGEATLSLPSSCTGVLLTRVAPAPLDDVSRAPAPTPIVGMARRVRAALLPAAE